MPNFDIPAVESVKAIRLRATLSQRYLEAFRRCDVLLTPAVPITV